MDITPRPNHHEYLAYLAVMSPQDKIEIVLELNAIEKERELEVIRRLHPTKSDAEIQKIYVQRRLDEARAEMAPHLEATERRCAT